MIAIDLYRHWKLADQRQPAADQNRFAKYLAYFGVAFWIAYLIFIGVMLPSMLDGLAPNMELRHTKDTCAGSQALSAIPRAEKQNPQRLPPPFCHKRIQHRMALPVRAIRIPHRGTILRPARSGRLLHRHLDAHPSQQLLVSAVPHLNQ